MKLRLKVLIILAGMWTIISLALFVYSKHTLSNEYSKLEKKEVVSDLERTTKTLRSLFSSLKTLNFDWSQWNDAYQFVKDKNPGFIRSNMAFTTFENSKLNLIMFFNPRGQLVYGLNYDLNAKKFIPIPESLLKQLLHEKSFTQQRSSSSSKVGFLKTADSYAVLSALPILTSEGTGPIRGTLVMGFFLTESHLAQLSDIVQMQVKLHPLPLTAEDMNLRSVYDYLHSGEPSYISLHSPQAILGYTFIRDIDNNPIGIISIKVPRTLYLEGLKTVEQYLAIVIGMGILFLAAVWYLLKVFILDRMIHLSQQVIEINSKNAFSQRLPITSKDELDEMAGAVNSLIEIIALTEEQLKNRISLRTEELERLSQLNKNLFSEMSNQKQIEVKLREGEKHFKHMAYYDVLTGLPNRLHFNEMAQKMMAKASVEDTHIAILFLDVDKFKSINDTHGHNIGDMYLRHIAEKLKASIRDTDLAARLAGDEFLVCLTDIHDKADITPIVLNMLNQLSQPLKCENVEIASSCSIGISIYPDDGNSIKDLEKNADLAMYYAKKNHENMYCFYHSIAKETTTD